jgi:hypothetical protein
MPLKRYSMMQAANSMNPLLGYRHDPEVINYYYVLTLLNVANEHLLA